jgi:ParB/RepB/Spo0J family partition protein
LKYLKKIPLDEIILAKHVARTRNVADVPDDLELSIRTHGLINPIIVSPNSENKFEIIDGQKRKAAYAILNKAHPEGKFEAIDCLVCEIRDENMQQATSLAANLYTVPMPREILTEKISKVWDMYRNFKIIEAKYGISERTVKKYVKYPRLPALIQDKINDKKITVMTSLAVVDAMNWTAADSEENLLEIIVELEKLKSNKRTYKKFIKLLENDPSIKSYDDIIRHHESSFREIKISIPEIMWDVIDSNFSVHLHSSPSDPFYFREIDKFPPKRVRSFSVSDMNVFILQSVLKYFDSHGIDYDKEKIKKMMDNHWMVRTIL